MDLEQSTMKETYIKLLADTLERKLLVTNQLLSLSEQQEQIITADKFEEELFLEVIDKKSSLIDNLNMLDSGFDQIYHKINEELISNKDLYKDKISVLQDLIKRITDISVSIQALENRNRNKLELLLSRKRKEIKSTRALGKTATNYYKTMAQQHEQQSYFYDKKN